MIRTEASGITLNLNQDTLHVEIKAGVSDCLLYTSSESFRLEKVELGDMVAMILSLGKEDTAYEERLAEIVDAMQKFIYDNFNFRVAVLAGEPHNGLEGVHLSWLEAKEAEEFVSVLDPDFISYREIRNSSHKKYDYPTEQEERIISAVKNHNSQLAVSYINKILDVNFLEIKASPEMFKYLLYDLIGTLMKAAQEVGEPSDKELGLNEISIKMCIRDRAWGIYGSALAYKFLRDDEYADIFCKVTDYFLEHLPKDMVPYWDFDFCDGSEEPRDSSAAAIAACGMLEMSKYLPEEKAAYYTGMARRLLYALVMECAVTDPAQSNGLLFHGTYAKSSPYNTCPNNGVDECVIWGDYFYMEALTRLSRDWEPYWY